MRPSKVLLASIFITATILVIVGGITTLVFASKTPTQAASADSAQPSAALDPQREEAYNQLIQQANQQLEEANQKLQALQSQVNQLSGGSPAQAQVAAAASPDQAAEIARQAAGKGRITVAAPDLVSFEGKPAYEVVFNQGSIYVDSQTGAVLYNGTVPQTITADKAAEVASQYLNLTDILQVDQVTIGNQPRYRIIFGDGTMAWVDLTGQIVDIQFRTHASTVDQQGSSGGSTNASAPTSNQHEDDHGGDD